MPYFLAGVLLLIILVLGARILAGANPGQLARQLRLVGGTVALLLAALFAIGGRGIVAAPLAGLGLMLLGRYFAHKRATPSGGGASEVNTDWLTMALDHDTGALDSVVKKGAFMGSRLSDLSLEELKTLLMECGHDDPSSGQLIEAFLDRTHPDWRDDAGFAGATGTDAGATASGTMTIDEALSILGLGPGASQDEIIAKHRELMKKTSPRSRRPQTTSPANSTRPRTYSSPRRHSGVSASVIPCNMSPRPRVGACSSGPHNPQLFRCCCRQRMFARGSGLSATAPTTKPHKTSRNPTRGAFFHHRCHPGKYPARTVKSLRPLSPEIYPGPRSPDMIVVLDRATPTSPSSQRRRGMTHRSSDRCVQFRSLRTLNMAAASWVPAHQAEHRWSEVRPPCRLLSRMTVFRDVLRVSTRPRVGACSPGPNVSIRTARPQNVRVGLENPDPALGALGALTPCRLPLMANQTFFCGPGDMVAVSE